MRETGLLDNTVVVFASDHGEMLGERGMWFKQCFFEWSARIPMIVRYPEMVSPGRNDSLVSLVDLLPTFMVIATDGKAPASVAPLDGHSLYGMLSGDRGSWDDQVISEYTGEGVLAPCRMLRRGKYKYIYTHGHPAPCCSTWSRIPKDQNDLIGNPSSQRSRASWAAAILDGWDPASINDQCIQSQKERLFIQETTGGGAELGISLSSG